MWRSELDQRAKRATEMRLTRCEKSSNGTFWKVIGSVALAALAVGVIYNIPDIKRYIKITTM